MLNWSTFRGYLSSEGTILVTVKLGNMTDDGMELPEEERRIPTISTTWFIVDKI